ncbi:ribulose-phosphate 3-epimerase [Microbacterium sp. PMB16]|uniref:ribulose-phosphate 3-epimerase n=1 Tax=Microbacterium sp. PMB16 TaxID=3120157 RepID=UPI003F4BC848
MSVRYSASVMTGDLANLETTIRSLEEAGIHALHVDILDGRFSPSMPIGLETARRIREITSLPLEAHVMSTNNDYFVAEMLSVGMETVTFHCESTLHVDRLARVIRREGAKAGVALNPATSLTALDWVLDELDKVCLMLINPGYATDRSEAQVPYAVRKIEALRDLCRARDIEVDLQVDGRVSIESVPSLVAAGATDLVLGSTSLFRPGATVLQNRLLLDAAVAEGLAAQRPVLA